MLDSTDPDVIAAFKERIDVEHCLFIIASKSGSTTEPNVFYKFWYEEVRKRREIPARTSSRLPIPDRHWSILQQNSKFHRTFLNQPDIGGRYSALSYFGMVPAALMGLDVRQLLEQRARSRELARRRQAALQLGMTWVNAQTRDATSSRSYSIHPRRR